jgi:processive 1,2-diacylglycerol beta-glucosyltransferase
MFTTLERAPADTPAKERPNRRFRLIVTDTGKSIGEISEEQLTFLVTNLEEESEGDQSYHFQPATLEMLKGRGADAELRQILLSGIGRKREVEIRWEEIPVRKGE